MNNHQFGPGQACVVKRDISIGTEGIAFDAGERVVIEQVQPNPQKPEYKYVVMSQKLNQRFQLRDVDLQAESTMPAGEPPQHVLPTAPVRGTPPPAKKMSPKAKRITVAVLACMVVLIIIIGVVATVSDSGKESSDSISSEKSTMTSENWEIEITSPPATSPQSTSPPPTPAPEPSIPPMSGSGDQVTAPFYLDGGLLVFHMQSSGSGNFIVELKSQDTGQTVELLANVIGSYGGSKAVGLSSGAYILNVQSSGSWTIGVEEPSSTNAPSTPQSYSGNGPTATGFFKPATGLVTLTMNHQGGGNFIVIVYESSGAKIDLVANEIGQYQGSQSVSLSTGTAYMLDVEADGPWSIEVK